MTFNMAILELAVGNRRLDGHIIESTCCVAIEVPIPVVRSLISYICARMLETDN